VAIGRISGALLFSDLDRQGTDLAFTTNGKPLTYMDFTSFRFGVNTNSLVDTFTVTGTANVSGITKIFGNLVAASGTPASDVFTGAFNVVGGAGITGNLYAGNIIANNISGNVSFSGDPIVGNVGVTNAGAFGSLNTANAVITGGYINGLANLTATTAQLTNFSTGNAVISGGYISALSNATITTGNVESWYSAVLNSTSANITTLYTNNFSTGNAVISGGYISSMANAFISNFSTGNAVITGGYISALSNATITTGNVESWYAGTLNATSANITTSYAVNFSTANASITGGNISGIVSANITTANITTAHLGNIKVEDITISSLTGNLILSPMLSNGNTVVAIAGTSALQLPVGTTAQQPTPVYAGAIRWNNSTNTLEVYTGSGWISLLSQINNQTISPDGTNTVYTLDYSTTAEGIIVSINGTLQQPGVAYTVAGTQITFAEIPLITDIISIRFIASGTITAENAQEINAGNIALTTTPIVVDSFDQSIYRSAKYMASTASAGSAEFAEFGIVQMGSTVNVSNVNRVITGSEITTFTANISGTTVRLWANTVSGTANIRLQKTYFVV